ncbi:Detected protein of confused Function [Hibiscus syriacus]|uniref:Detected protein of confused Function n=1 Tax=Hibiscus syriacus TaxID=106335 RepID=A0A6A2Y0S4_HIBSY|nr:dynein regulatory complex subunit 3 [Hibiscus syriacus]KAE8673655.1 Detected protein of confused Function [Hibiscus syriacus]
MARLTKEHLLKDGKTRDPASITSLSLSHKALSDVSCLAEFKNLERLDLAFNNLTSLQGLKSCVNLKWLSVVQNKLETLEGIEGLTKLTVLNAGKNKLRSMEEVKPLVNLRALILNDNQLVSICGLDEMKDLNTLVLSRNPITKIGSSLMKLKSITKFSASNCQIQAIESSLKCCVELKELRLAHNDIKILPAELSYNKKIQNLDLGNNLITRWSELKALDSLVNLKNLNLQGNPIAEKDKLAKKVKRLLPNLQIFNARPIDKSVKNKDSETVAVASHSMDYTEDIYMEDKKGQKRKKNPEFQVSVEKQDVNHDNAPDLDTEKESKRKKKKGNDKVSVDEGDGIVVEKNEKKKSKGEQENLSRLDAEKNITQKGRKTNDKQSKKEVSVHEDGIAGEEKPKKKKMLEKRAELDIIDDSGASFTELFANDAADPIDDCKRKIVDRADQYTKSSDHSVTYPAKKKKGKHVMLAELQLSPAIEVGMGGASTWDDE